MLISAPASYSNFIRFKSATGTGFGALATDTPLWFFCKYS
nr:MAG TPA: hypothetical protein [Caudoviricetes sp.]DAR82194.1 MAG TPA: hypothetical protein [Caudoviricetes sp.]DAS05591.1 MAG TPA: hypothetical protein [Caudoviricetes sp.]DAX59616.1 MAG TPA: hypothetical protein [Caudoviricetes sp.]